MKETNIMKSILLETADIATLFNGKVDEINDILIAEYERRGHDIEVAKLDYCKGIIEHRKDCRSIVDYFCDPMFIEED